MPVERQAVCGGLSNLDCFLPVSESNMSMVGSEASTAILDNRSYPKYRPPSPPMSPPKLTRHPVKALLSGEQDDDDKSFENEHFVNAQSVAILPTATSDEEEEEEEDSSSLPELGRILLLKTLSKQKSEEISSTASEMGTVIDQQQRIRDVEEIETNPSTTTLSTKYDTPPQQELLVEDMLSLPLLEQPNVTNQREGVPLNEAEKSDNNDYNNSILQNLRRWVPRSAPTTPVNARYHTTDHISDDNKLPRSFLLRSPGSSAAHQLLPRFKKHWGNNSTNNSPRHGRPPARNDAEGSNTAGSSKYPYPLQRQTNTLSTVARSCFSFDTAIDDHYEVPQQKLFRQHYPPPRHSASWDGHVLELDTSAKINFEIPVQRVVPTQRLEIEREDALDILACLVERGVSFDEFNTSPTEIRKSLDDLQTTSIVNKEQLEELLRSHEYALEMQRASLSASAWLESIGRKQPTPLKPSLTEETSEQISDKDEASVCDDGSENRHDDVEPKQPFPIQKQQQPAGEESSASEAIDLLAAKALLHSAQMEILEKQKKFDQLNEELAKCRAEIGRLKTTQQQTSFRSPNRSILDESDDLSTNEEEVEVEVIESVDSQLLDDVEVESSFINEPNEKVQKYQSRLDEANDVIRTLHAELGRDPDTAPVIEFDESTPPRPSPSNKEFDTINVRMLDGENFVTDWYVMDLTSPPDHDLDSPIVRSILEAWTSDRNLHESLLAWMEQVLAGNDPDTIRPLSVSSLDHRVRDGFSLHVLPLLLKRPDILVDVRTRAHRRTTYDLSVSVDKTIQRRGFMPIRSNLENKSARSDAESAVNSSASTALMSNTTFVYEKPPLKVSTSRLSYDEVSEDIQSPDEPLQPGLMGALGGAFTGLLTRRHMQTITESPESMAGLEEQPYHRVVSAPPGRIGVTFVEYRGHCMVSDVSPHSNLMGWIFPSDVLIAIDELPVSGMRIRDIIQVLKDRQERQRALRVISSHAMNELTLGDDISS